MENKKRTKDKKKEVYETPKMKVEELSEREAMGNMINSSCPERNRNRNRGHCISVNS